jgi:hypothetical protein
MLCLCFFPYSYSASRYSYSKRSSIAIRPIGPKAAANGLDQRSASPQFEQPSSTSTVSLSTASLSSSTTKSDAMRGLPFYRFFLQTSIDRHLAFRVSCPNDAVSAVGRFTTDCVEQRGGFFCAWMLRKKNIIDSNYC